MSKSVLGGIITVVVLLIVLGQLPSGDVTDSKSAVKSAQQGLVIDTTIDAGGQVINELSKQSIDNACKDPNSTSCNHTKNSVSWITLTWAIVIIAVIIDGLIGFTKWIVRSIEVVADLF